MEPNYYTYSDEIYECKNCNWRGLGKETKKGEMFGELFEIDCPQCNESIGHICYPTTEETLRFGNDKEKEEAREHQKRMNSVEEMFLQNINDLPNIDKSNIIFKLEVSKDLKYILLKHDNKIIWKEMRTYEYYSRYFEIGKLLKLKYKEKIADFIPSNEIDRVYFYGDCSLSTINDIDIFRESFKRK